MTRPPFCSPRTIRSVFSTAMSAIYRDEVPAYGGLVKLVAEVDNQVLREDPVQRDHITASDDLDRISEERHSAIRPGTMAELHTMPRLFPVMGMVPVGYCDLSAAGMRVHSTAFRPVCAAVLRRNSFRVFTSLPRIDLIADWA